MPAPVWLLLAPSGERKGVYLESDSAGFHAHRSLLQTRLRGLRFARMPNGCAWVVMQLKEDLIIRTAA